MTLTKITSKSIKDNEIVNADLHSAAAIASTKLAKPIDLADDEKIRLGTGNDFEIFHQASNSNSIIRETGGGNLSLQTNGTNLNFYDSANDATLASFITGGAANLFHSGTKRFETTSTGVDVTGQILQSETGGNNKFTTKRTGAAGSNNDTFFEFKSLNAADQEIGSFLFQRESASDDSYFILKTRNTGGSNTERFRVTSTGNIQIPNDSGKLQLGVSQDLEIYHDGTNSFVKDNATAGQFIIDGYNGIDLRQGSTGDLMTRMTGGGAIQLYHNNALRFQTTGDGAKLQNNGDGGSDVLMLVQNERDDSGSDAILRLRVSNGSAHSEVQFGDAGNMDTGIIDYHHSNNRMRFTVDATEVWQTRSNGICPSNTGKNCGFSNSTNRWADVRSSNFGGSSDRNEKNTIVPSDLGLDFINKLKPVSFKWNDGVAGRTHYGLVAQDIEDLLPDFGKTAMDFAALCKDTFTEDENGNTVDPYDVYSLRYMEFTAPLVKAIQELTAKVAALEAA